MITMSENNKNKKDILYRVKDFPRVKPSEDFLERLHSKIELIKSGSESENYTKEGKTFTDKLREFFEKYSRPYLVPAFGILALAVIIYYFAAKSPDNENKEIITNKTNQENKNPQINPNEKPPVILSENDRKKLDSLLTEEKKKLDKTTKNIEKSVRSLAENNSRNINKIFTGLNKPDTSRNDTLNADDIQKAGIGPDIDRGLNLKIDKINKYVLESLRDELNKGVVRDSGR